MIRHTRSRRGLTLMELVVVMTILIALASILIPILPGMLNRAHTSTGATNVSELTKAVQLYEQMNFRYPDQLDALNDGTTATVANYLGGPLTQTQLTMRTLAADEAEALTKSGITNLLPMHPTLAAVNSDGADATFNPYVAPGTPLPVAAGLVVTQVNENALETLIVRQPAGDNYGDVYVTFGVGDRCTLVGKAMSGAPLHFPDNPTLDPKTSYGRFGLVFRIARGVGAVGSPTSETVGRAEFVGVIEFHETSISASDSHIREFYNSTR